MVAWTQRWHSDASIEELISKDRVLEADWNKASLTQLVFFPMVPYLAWAVAYYAKVFAPLQIASFLQNTKKSRRLVWAHLEAEDLILEATWLIDYKESNMLEDI